MWKVRAFLRIAPRPFKEERLFKEIGSQIHSALRRRSPQRLLRTNHSSMASVPSSSARSGLEKGEWERCSVSHSRLTKLQTQGFLPHADLVPVRTGLAFFNEGTQEEDFPNPSGGSECVLSPTCLEVSNFQSIRSSEGFWSIMASNCTILLLPPSCTS